MPRVKNWGTWIAERVYTYNATDESIVNDAMIRWGNISKAFVLEEIRKVRNNPELYKKLHNTDG